MPLVLLDGVSYGRSIDGDFLADSDKGIGNGWLTLLCPVLVRIRCGGDYS